MAPHQEASAIGHALTLRRPLRVEQLEERGFEVDGTPPDCVNGAITQILRHTPRPLGSGINKGFHLCADVTYSGEGGGRVGLVGWDVDGRGEVAGGGRGGGAEGDDDGGAAVEPTCERLARDEDVAVVVLDEQHLDRSHIVTQHRSCLLWSGPPAARA